MSREYDLDAARSALMMLGVVLHAANVYAEPATWLVSDPVRSEGLRAVSDTIHVFRIPAFFVVAGFFAGFSLERYGPGGFLRRRCVRLVVPLVCSGVVLGLLQNWLLYRHGVAGYGPEGGGTEGLVEYLGTDAFQDGIREGLWVTHLWFLVNLIVYVFAMALLASIPAVGRGCGAVVERLNRTIDPRGLFVRRALFLFVLPFGALLSQVLTGVTPGAYDSVFGVTSLYTLLAYAPYFVVGVFAFRAREYFEALRAPGFWVFLALALVAAGNTLLTDSSGRVVGALRAYGADLVVWLSISIVLAAFRRFASRPSTRFAYLSEASYTVYLFHHLCVLGLGILLAAEMPASIGPWVRFTMVVITTTLATLALHHFAILRFSPLRFAFNGKWR